MATPLPGHPNFIVYFGKFISTTLPNSIPCSSGAPPECRIRVIHKASISVFNRLIRLEFSSRTQMLTVSVMINVMIIGQPPVTAIIRWRARLAYESTVTVMDLR